MVPINIINKSKYFYIMKSGINTSNSDFISTVASILKDFTVFVHVQGCRKR